MFWHVCSLFEERGLERLEKISYFIKQDILKLIITFLTIFPNHNALNSKIMFK